MSIGGLKRAPQRTQPAGAVPSSAAVGDAGSSRGIPGSACGCGCSRCSRRSCRLPRQVGLWAREQVDAPLLEGASTCAADGSEGSGSSMESASSTTTGSSTETGSVPCGRSRRLRSLAMPAVRGRRRRCAGARSAQPRLPAGPGQTSLASLKPMPPEPAAQRTRIANRGRGMRSISASMAGRNSCLQAFFLRIRGRVGAGAAEAASPPDLDQFRRHSATSSRTALACRAGKEQ